MIHQNESEVSSEKCVEHDPKMPPTKMQSKDRPKIQKDIGSKIPMLWPDKKDTRGIPKEDTQVQTKKARWSGLKKIKAIGIEAKQKIKYSTV